MLIYDNLRLLYRSIVTVLPTVYSLFGAISVTLAVIEQVIERDKSAD